MTAQDLFIVAFGCGFALRLWWIFRRAHASREERSTAYLSSALGAAFLIIFFHEEQEVGMLAGGAVAGALIPSVLRMFRTSAGKAAKKAHDKLADFFAKHIVLIAGILALLAGTALSSPAIVQVAEWTIVVGIIIEVLRGTGHKKKGKKT